MHYTGLALARALHRCGAGPIYGLGANEAMFGNVSRYCRYLPSPDTLISPHECRDFLMQWGNQLDKKPLLFPTRDHDLQFVARFYDDLRERFLVTTAPPDILQTILNKASLYRVAATIGVPYPATAWIDSRTDLERASGELRFPVIVKPVYSTQWRKKELWDLVGRQKAVVINDRDELHRFYARIESADPKIHIQEFIAGADTDLVVFGSYVNPTSGALRYFTGRKLLQYPAASGTGVAVQACAVPSIVDTSRKLLSSLDYRGVSEIEYKYDREHDRYVLIEINPRFWDQHALGIRVGVNLAECLFLDMTQGRVPQQIQQTKTITWIAEDSFLGAFLSNLKRQTSPTSAFFRALKGSKTLAIFDWADWRPAMRAALQFVRDRVRGVLRRPSARQEDASMLAPGTSRSSPRR